MYTSSINLSEKYSSNLSFLNILILIFKESYYTFNPYFIEKLKFLFFLN